MRPLILCDFDGTITTRDMGYLLLNRFSSGDWEPIDREFSEGRMGSREAYSKIAEIFRGEEADVLGFIRDHAAIDPFFLPFYRYCRDSKIDLKIVSDGLDFYIRTILDAHHLSDIPFYANRADFIEGSALKISFPYHNEECGLCGTCKKSLLQALRREYDSVFYVGNGLSDRCAAGESDFVFAKDLLYSYCVERDIPCRFFESFETVLGDLKKRMMDFT